MGIAFPRTPCSSTAEPAAKCTTYTFTCIRKRLGRRSRSAPVSRSCGSVPVTSAPVVRRDLGGRVPYLETLADEACATGIPVLRHLALEYPEDRAATHMDDEYLLGSALRVAPVFEAGADAHTVRPRRAMDIMGRPVTPDRGPTLGDATRSARTDTAIGAVRRGYPSLWSRPGAP